MCSCECPDGDSTSIRTPRLTLREARIEDAPFVARHANDRTIAEMTRRIPHPYTLADAERFLGSGSDDEIHFAILLADADGPASEPTFIGITGLQARPAHTVELGYWLGRPYWNRGLATEAAQAMLDFAFGALGVATVEVRCRVVNGASRRVIQKCGFQYGGTGMGISLAAGRVANEVYRMDRKTWLSLKSWGVRP